MSDEDTSADQTDLDLITDHQFQPMRDGWEDTCGHLDLDGWPCGFEAVEHAVERPGGGS